MSAIKRIVKKYGVKVSPQNIDDYFFELYKSGHKATYMNYELNVLRKYCEMINCPDWLTVKFFKETETIKSILTVEEINKVINCPRPYKQPLKVYEMYCLFWRIFAETGMRSKEIATLRKENLTSNGVNLFITKTTKPRFVPLIPTTHALLEKYALTKKDYLFTPLNKEVPINKWLWGNNFRLRCKQLGMKRQGLTAYSMRHSKVTRMIEQDISPFKIRKLVGHACLETTLAYEHLTTKDVIIANEQDILLANKIRPEDKIDRILESLKSWIGQQDNFSYKKENNKLQIEINFQVDTPI